MKNAVLLALVVLSTAPVAAGPVPTKGRAKRVEPDIVADLRAFAAAEAAYAKQNGGFFDEPPCLVKPSTCLKGHPAGKPALLSPELARMDMKDGFNRSFHSGDKATDAIAKGTVSPSSLEGFAYVAVPQVKGQPAYCVDHHRMCVQKDGIMPRPEGSCPRGCETMGSGTPLPGYSK